MRAPRVSELGRLLQRQSAVRCPEDFRAASQVGEGGTVVNSQDNSQHPAPSQEPLVAPPTPAPQADTTSPLAPGHRSPNLSRYHSQSDDEDSDDSCM